MKTAIEKIIIMEHIRKEVTRISELATDIEKNGLLHPVTVMPIDEDKLRLLAGLRRVKAAQSLGWSEIDVNIVSPSDAETALKIEISENEQREPLTYSEKMKYAEMFEEIEKAKSKERQVESGTGYGRGGKIKVEDGRPQPLSKRNLQTRDIVGDKIDMSGRQYDRAKYVSENAPPEVVEQLDKGEVSISGVYNELIAKEKASKQQEKNGTAESDTGIKPDKQEKSAPPKPKFKLPSSSASEEEQMKYLSEKDKKAVRKLREFNSLSPEDKIIELERQIEELRARAAIAESDLASLKQRYEITVDHKDSIIESLKRQNSELCAALDEANEKIEKFGIK